MLSRTEEELKRNFSLLLLEPTSSQAANTAYLEGARDHQFNELQEQKSRESAIMCTILHKIHTHNPTE